MMIMRYSKVLVDAGTGDVLYVTDAKSFAENKKKKHSDNTKDSKHDKKMRDYYKDMTPEQIAEKKNNLKKWAKLGNHYQFQIRLQ